jgi:hypothetical protein
LQMPVTTPLPADPLDAPDPGFAAPDPGFMMPEEDASTPLVGAGLPEPLTALPDPGSVLTLDPEPVAAFPEWVTCPEPQPMTPTRIELVNARDDVGVNARPVAIRKARKMSLVGYLPIRNCLILPRDAAMLTTMLMTSFSTISLD